VNHEKKRKKAALHYDLFVGEVQYILGCCPLKMALGAHKPATVSCCPTLIQMQLAQYVDSESTHLALGKEKFDASSCLSISDSVIFALFIVAQRIEAV
jgi:hypothetical protein